MKVLIVLAAIFAMVCADDWRVQTAEDLAGYRTECVKDLDVPEERVTEFKSWKFDESYEKTECYIKCVFVKMGLFTEEAGFNVDHLTSQLGQGREDTDEVRAEVTKCADSNPDKDDACKWAYRGFKCFREKNFALIKASVKKD